MAAVQKKKKSRKSSTYKSNPYPANDSKNIDSGNTLLFGPTFKSSNLSNSQNILNGSNPILQFPIPNIDPMKATLLNDEVDMYFPRKHFLTKYQMLNDLIENILIKPIPTDKIIPPRLFPIAFVEGMPYEKKKLELLSNIKKEVPTKENQQDIEKPIDNSSTKDNIKIDKIDKNDIDNDESLSDYDPDFDGNHPNIYPEPTEEETKIIDSYLDSRKNIKERTDFLFGDLGTMKMQETSLIEDENKIEESLKQSAELSDKYKYNIKVLDNLRGMYLKYTANSIQQNEKELNEIEEDIKSKFKTKFTDTNKIKKFKTKAFDSIKVEISLDEYNQKFKKQPLQSAISFPENSLPVNDENSLAQPNFEGNMMTENKQQDIKTPIVPLPADSNLGVTEAVKDSTNEVADDVLGKKENSNSDLNNFDFENEMLYESQDFNNNDNDNDEDFGSLSNEVFLNM